MIWYGLKFGAFDGFFFDIGGNSLFNLVGNASIQLNTGKQKVIL